MKFLAAINLTTTPKAANLAVARRGCPGRCALHTPADRQRAHQNETAGDSGSQGERRHGGVKQ